MSSAIPGILMAGLAGVAAFFYGTRTHVRGIGGFFIIVFVAFFLGVGAVLAGSLLLNLMRVSGLMRDEGYGVFIPIFGFPLYCLLIYGVKKG